MDLEPNGKKSNKSASAFISKEQDENDDYLQPDILTKRGALMQVGFKQIIIKNMLIKDEPLLSTINR